MLIAWKNFVQEKTQKLEYFSNFYCLIKQKSLLKTLVEIITAKESELLKFATIFTLDIKRKRSK